MKNADGGQRSSSTLHRGDPDVNWAGASHFSLTVQAVNYILESGLRPLHNDSMQKMTVQSLIKLFSDEFTAWRTTDGAVYATSKEGQVCPLNDPAMMGMAAKAAGDAYWTKKVWDDAILWLFSQAQKEPPREAHLRIASKGGDLFYDGGSELVKFSGGKWASLKRTDGPSFIKGAGSLPQVKAEQSDASFVDMLGTFLHVPRTTLLQLTGWLVGCFQSGGPYPILMLNGEQGSAKSTTTRLLRRLVDPHALDMRDPSLDDRGFVAAARNSFVLAFDNVSYMPNKMSDLLCRVATGTAALGTRQLYTDHAEAAFTVLRPVILNGIPEVVQREDFASRTITITLPTIPNEKRRDDAEFWKSFEAVHSRLQGALYSMVAKAHAERDLNPLTDRPRLVGFLQWSAAAFSPEDRTAYLNAFAQAQAEGEAALLEQDLFLQGIIAMMQSKKEFTGSIFQLFQAISTHVPMGFSKDHLPNTPKGVHERIKRGAPILRRAGITMHKGGREAKSGRRQLELRWSQQAVAHDYSVTVA